MKITDWIISETENWVAVNKPSGLLSIPDREGKEISLKVLLKEKYGNIFTVHRIDRDTSGLIVFAKNEAAHKHLCKQFEDRQTKKIYTGLVIGSPANKKGSIDSPIAEHPALNGTMIVHRKGKESLTDYEVLEDFGIYSLLQFQIHTGRTHQIRVHMKYIGHPLFNDDFYGGDKIVKGTVYTRYKQFVDNCFQICQRQALHAKTLGFTHPTSGKEMFFDTELPEDMEKVIEKWRKYASTTGNKK